MKTMKMAIMFIALAAISAESFAALHLSDIRREARFLTDRMGYELGLSNRQYNDAYEINFDFLYQVNEVIDDVVYGYDDAIDYYYYLLDIRNEDLMYVLRRRQYHKFVNRDYFYRPIYMGGYTWRMRIWDQYVDRNYFHFGVPTCYYTYTGAHYRIHFVHSYYARRYSHALYHGAFRLWGGGYHHHHHDGWKYAGKKKYVFHSSRPWSNAKNYEKSYRNLKDGFVNIPSRDVNKRVVKVDSEENRRTALTSNSPIRTRVGRAVNTSNTAGSRASVATNSNERNTGSISSSQDNAVRTSASNRQNNTSTTARSNNSSRKVAGSATRQSSSGTSLQDDNKMVQISTSGTNSSRTSRNSSTSVSKSSGISSQSSSKNNVSRSAASSSNSSMSSTSNRSSSSQSNNMSGTSSSSFRSRTSNGNNNNSANSTRNSNGSSRSR